VEIKIKTLTPIWTGDTYRKSGKLRETSIIGSLRWWFEAIVRGLGGKACDSVSSEKCEYKSNTHQICTVCHLFGCTGWSRRFSVNVDSFFKEIFSGTLKIRGTQKSWYYDSGIMSVNNAKMTIKPVFPLNLKEIRDDEILESVMKVLLGFISNWGMVGGKTAIGYGVAIFGDKSSAVKPSKMI